MNLIQTKQVENLDNEFTNLSGALVATGQILVNFLSGDATFSGLKTFTGRALFRTGVRIMGPLSGVDGMFDAVGINLRANERPSEGLHISGKNLLVEPSLSPVTGGNATIDGVLTITGQNRAAQQVIPRFIQDSGILYQTGNPGVLPPQLNIGFRNPIKGGGPLSDPYVNRTFNVSGDSQILGNLNISGTTTLAPLKVSGNLEASASYYGAPDGIGIFENGTKISGAYTPAWSGVPAGTSSPGTPGAMAFDAGFLYICTEPNSWRKVGISTW